MKLNKIRNFIRKKKQGMGYLCENIAKDLENQAKTNAKWTDRTGNARQGINGKSNFNGKKATITLSHGVSYGRILEEGSKPHIIRPRKKKALWWDGLSKPVDFVMHPGTKGKPIIKPTIDKNYDKIKKDIVNYWRD